MKEGTLGIEGRLTGELRGHGGREKTTRQAYGSDLANLEPIEELAPRLFR